MARGPGQEGCVAGALSALGSVNVMWSIGFVGGSGHSPTFAFSIRSYFGGGRAPALSLLARSCEVALQTLSSSNWDGTYRIGQ